MSAPHSSSAAEPTDGSTDDPPVWTLFVILALLGYATYVAWQSDLRAMFGASVVLFAMVVFTAAMLITSKLQRPSSSATSPVPVTPPASDPVIDEIDELYVAGRRRIEHVNALKRKLRAEYGDDPPEHVRDLLDDLDEMIVRARMRQARGR